ncbi:MAG: hypothetical protein U0T82_11170 [Bacteroidales bacterium]
MISKGIDLGWSHDGSKLAIISNDSLFTVNKDGTNKRLIATGAYSKPSWSDDDKYILYQGFSAGHSIQLVESDGSSNKELVGSEYIPFMPEWSPDGEQISFVGLNTPEGSTLYVMNKDGSNLFKVPNTGSYVSIFQTPSWTPDGGTILFTTGFDNEHDLYLINTDGSNVRRLKIDSLWEEYAVLINNGNSILFSSAGNIYRMNTDLTGIINLTGNVGNNFCPRPSPDESMIAFSGYRDGQDGLFIMQADGSGVRRLFSSSFVAQSCYAWSPDGKEIAFVAARLLAGNSTELCIFVLKVQE